MIPSSANTDQTPMNGTDLTRRWQQYRHENPQIRIRDAASLLGVSEAELVASGCGNTSTRLTGPWPQLVAELETLGPVLALTRNDHAVHETYGHFKGLQLAYDMGIALGDNIDLRIRFKHWHFGFAVTENGRSGERRSLQFFDRDGAAVHKVYLTEDSHDHVYHDLVQRFRSEHQTPGLQVVTTPTPTPDRPDTEIDVINLRLHWKRLRNTHNFRGLLEDFGVSRLQALRLVGEPLARQVAISHVRTLLEGCADRGVPIMVFVSSPGVTQIHSGVVKKLLATGPWFNILDPGFNLHLRDTELGSAWVVRKPSDHGEITSLEVFDKSGCLTAMFFEQRTTRDRENPDWSALLDTASKDIAEYKA